MVRTPRHRDSGRGWHNQSERHKLARMGIKTAIKDSPESRLKIMNSKPNLNSWNKVKNYWVNKQEDSLTFVEIIKESETDNYVVVISKHKKGTDKVDKEFNEFETKPKASKFVEDYMESH